MRVHPKALFRLAALAALILLPVSCRERGDRYVRFGGYAQGGVWQVKCNLRGADRDAPGLQAGVDSILRAIDRSLSGYNKGSLLSRYNRGEQVRPDTMMRELYRISRALWKETDGALDVAAGPLFDAWGFGFTQGSLPGEDTVRALLGRCGMGHLTDTLPPPGGAQLNFNAIAQGYSCDLVAAWLRRCGVRDMLVDIGEIYCAGTGPKGRPWTLGVDRPEDGNQSPGRQIEGVFSVRGSCGVVTSGNYRKYYIRDGRKYAHTIDPRTGRPVTHSLLSATVIAPDATLADAYATACMVYGPEEAKRFLESKDGVEGYLLYEEDGALRAWHSSAFPLR